MHTIKDRVKSKISKSKTKNSIVNKTYENFQRIGQGTYSHVYKAKNM